MMGVLRAEILKAVTLAGVRRTLIAGAVIPALLTWFNARAALRGWQAGADGWTTQDLAQIGVTESLLAAAALAAVGVMLVSSEYRELSVDQGGGYERVTTALAIPRRGPGLAAKMLVALLLMVPVAVTTNLLSTAVALWILEPAGIGWDRERIAGMLAGCWYMIATGLLGASVTMVLRSGLVPMVYLVVNNTLFSPGFLLTRLTAAAWYLPDTSLIGLVVARMDDPHQPTKVVSGLVAAGWLAVVMVVAWVLERRRPV